MAGWGAYGLRRELAAAVRRRRTETALFTLGVIGVLIALGYLSARYPMRFDVTEAGLHSLSPQTSSASGRICAPARR